MGPKLLRVILGAAGITAAALLLTGHPLETVSLTIRCANGRTTFQVGELIPVELLYSSTTEGRYLLTSDTGGRTGPSTSDNFEVIPPARDPLFLYVKEIAALFLDGGAAGTMAVGNKPVALPHVLNEWVVFDHPGHFQVRATSQRVTVRGLRQPLVVESRNTLDLTINLADPKWQRTTLAEAMASLDKSVYERKAQQTIRFLDTPESVRELTHRLTQPGNSLDDWNYTAGLMGARDQAFVVRELQARFQEPDAALTRRYVWLLARLQYVQTHGQQRPDHTQLPTEHEHWQAKRKERLQAMQLAEDELWKQVAAILPRKNPRAREETRGELVLAGRFSPR